MLKKESNRPTWDEFFMLSAYWAATRSSCLQINTGAVIVKDKRIIATGYNGAPTGIRSCLEFGFCNKENLGVNFDTKGTGTCKGEHAERNAMSQVGRKNLEGSTIYTVYFPCSPCAKTITGNGIVKVFYSKIYKEKESLAEEIFKEKGIEVAKMDLDFEKMFIFFKNLK